MNWQNSILILLIANSLTGSLAYTIWKIVSILLSKHKLYTLCNQIFSIMLWFWIIPFVFAIYILKQVKFFNGIPYFLKGDTLKYIDFIMYIWVAGVCLIALWLIFALYKIKYKPIYYNHKNVPLAIKIADSTIIRAWLKDDSNHKHIYPGLNYGEPVQIYCTSVPVPMVKVGHVPSIYLPAVDYYDQDLSVVVFHELSHIMRGDLIVRSCILWLQVIFWFNPLVYLMVYDFEQWSETACDIDVCSGRFGDISKNNYLNILLKNASHWTNAMSKDTFAKNYFVSHLSPEGKRLKKRMTRLMEFNYKENNKKISNITSIGYVVITLVFILMIAFLLETYILNFAGWF